MRIRILVDEDMQQWCRNLRLREIAQFTGEELQVKFSGDFC